MIKCYCSQLTHFYIYLYLLGIRRVEHFIHNATNLSVYNATLNDDKENNDGSEDSGLFDDELNETDTLIAIGDLINKPRSAIHLKSDGRFHKIGKYSKNDGVNS